MSIIFFSFLILGLSAACGPVIYLRLHQFEQGVPVVRLSNEDLQVTYSNKLIEANIKNCRVRRGWASNMRLRGVGRILCRRRTLIIYLPSGPKGQMEDGYDYSVAVGYTPDMRTLWEKELGKVGIMDVEGSGVFRKSGCQVPSD